MKLEDIENLVNQGKIIQASKLYRDRTGQGLKESKAAVDFFRNNGYWKGVNRQEYIEAASSEHNTDAFQAVEEFLAQGQKIRAIKEYQNQTSCGLQEALQAIEYFQLYGRWTDENIMTLSQLSTQDRNNLEILAENPSRKIAAIKEYRRLINCGLKESKEEVEFFAANGYWRDLGPSSAPSI